MNNQTASTTVIEVEGKVPSADELSWIRLGHNLFKKSPDLANDIAKTFVTLSTTLITIYIGILTFLKIPESISVFDLSLVQRIIIAIIISSPFVLWALSIWKNVDVYSPRLIKCNLDCPQDIETSMKDIINNKNKELNKGRIFFLAGLFVAALIIIGSSSLTQTSSVKFIINEDHLLTFKNVPISIHNQTRITTSLTLIEEGDNFYKVRLESGKIIKFNKNIVEGVIYD